VPHVLSNEFAPFHRGPATADLTKPLAPALAIFSSCLTLNAPKGKLCNSATMGNLTVQNDAVFELTKAELGSILCLLKLFLQS
jgi:hypothetical protein